MDGEGPTAILAVGPLALRIKQLELEERDAIRRREWSTATGIAQERAALKEAYHRALVGSQTTNSSRNHDGWNCA